MQHEGKKQMQIDWDVQIEMDDGVVLRADMFRPAAPGRYPVILSHGVYGKGLPIERFRYQLNHLATSLPEHVLVPDVADATTESSNNVADDDYRVWEVVDPSEWVPHGYVCIRVDSRGSGNSLGKLDPMSPRQIRDFAACIDWAGTQDWSSGRVGLCGKSYYAMTQWLVAALKPRYLTAICVWHGLSDWYRDATRHGGIIYEFWEKFWYPRLVLPVQHGLGPQVGLNPHSGHPITGDETSDATALEASRVDIVADIRAHPFDDDYYQQRTPRLDQVSVPVLASADWSDQDLHLRGTIYGFLNVASTARWLEVHAGGQFDDPSAVNLQRRFFDHYLKDEDNDWCDQPQVQLTVRHADGTSTIRTTSEWPVLGTDWRPYYLDLTQEAMFASTPESAFQTTYEADGSGVTLHTTAMTEDTTIIGPVSATLWLSSSTTDADLFLVLDAIDPKGQRVELRDHRGGITPMSVGWLRASHRSIDPARSTSWQPYHTHRSSEPLVPGRPYEVRVDLRPTNLHLPAGYRLRLTISGHGRLHNDPVDRPAELFANAVTLYSGPGMTAHLLIPIVPNVPADVESDLR